MQKATKLLFQEFVRQFLLGIAFISKVVYYIVFAWWLHPLLTRKMNRELVEDIKRDLDFLILDPSSIQIVRADWPEAKIPWKNLLFTIVEARGDVSVLIAPRHAPTKSYELGPLVAAVESRHYSERDVVHTLADAARILKPRLNALNVLFSEEQFPSVRTRF